MFSKKDLDNTVLKLSDVDREIYYTEVKWYYIGDPGITDKLIAEENNGLLTFKLKENIRNEGHSTRSNTSNKYLSYHIPLDEDFTRCVDILNSSLIDKKTNKRY